MCLNFRKVALNFFITFIFSTFYISITQGQQLVKFAELDKMFYNYEILDIDAAAVHHNIISSTRGNAVKLKINEQAEWNLLLENSGIISPQYLLVTSNENGLSQKRGTTALPMQGSVEGVAGSQVSLTFNNDFIYGFIRLGQNTYFIEPLYHFVNSGQKNKFVMYSINDIIPGEEKVCGYEQYMDEKQKIQPSHQNNSGSRMPGGCFKVEYAIASDFSMVSGYGSVTGVENHNIGVLNNVQTNYDNDFADEIQFLLVEQWVSNCPTCDPWTTSTDAGTLLNSFRAWGPSGFSSVHDVASVWTRRDFNGGTIGIAWKPGVCTGSRYNALQDFSSNAQLKRCLVSHEIGHNFDASHNSDIMAPSVSTSNTWSSTSVSEIQSYYLNISCLSACSSGVAPTANFSYNTSLTCAPVSVQFSDQSVGSTSRIWSFPGGTPSSSTAASPTVTYPSSGQYQVTLQAINNFGTNNITQPVTVNAIPLPSPNFIFNVNANDNNVQFTYTGTSVTSYSWDFGDGSAISNLPNPQHTYTQNGTFNVTLHVTNACGTNSITFPVTISVLPRANFTSNQNTGCQPLTVNFSNLSENAAFYQWTFPGGNPATSNDFNPTVLYSTPGTFAVVLEAFNDAGSAIETKVDYITVSPLPVADFIVNINGSNASFVFQGGFQNSISWNFGDGTSQNGTINPVHQYAVNGTYNVTLTVSNLCGTRQITYPITIAFLPFADFLANTTSGCGPLSVNFSNFSTNAETYLWTFEGGIPATSTASSPVVMYSQPGLHNVKLEVFNSFGNVTLVKSNYIDVFPEPIANFSYSQEGTVFSFADESQFYNTLSWDFGDGSQSSEINPVHIYNDNGIYNVTLSLSNACGSNNIMQEIVVALPPAASFLPANSATICEGELVQFQNTSTFGPVTYLWSFEGGIPSTSTEPNPEVTFPVSGVYDISLIVSNANGSDQILADNLVVVNHKPTISFETAVNGYTVNFTQNVVNGTNALWNFGDGQTSTSVNPTHTYNAQGTFTVTLSDSNGCGMTTKTKDILIQLLPTAGFTSSVNTICPSSNVQFTSQSSPSVTAWNWVFDGGTPATSTLRNPVVKYDQPGNYSVSLVVTNLVGEGNVLIDEYVKVVSLPDASYSVVVDSNRVILQSTGSLNNELMWSIYSDGLTNQFEGQNITFSAPGNGNYFVYLTSKNQCGQVMSDTVEVLINIFPEAILKFNNNSILCSGNEVVFENESKNAANYHWSFEGGIPSVSSDSNPKVIFNQKGTYEITLIVSNSLGSDTIVSSVNIGNGPTALFTYDVPSSGNVQFNYTGSDETSLLWNFGDESTSSEKNPLHTYTKSGIYTVTLVVENLCGKDTFQREVNVLISSSEDLIVAGKLIIVPNPGEGEFNLIAKFLTEGEYDVKILDVLGRNVYRKSMFVSGSDYSERFDLRFLNDGLYFLILDNGSRKINQRIVIAR
jgi:PKD repeat protein